MAQLLKGVDTEETPTMMPRFRQTTRARHSKGGGVAYGKTSRQLLWKTIDRGLPSAHAPDADRLLS